MAFDPSQFGATPVATPPTGSFDPSTFGATPVPPTNPTSSPTHADSIWTNIVNGGANIVKSIEQPFVSLAAKPVQLLAKGLGQPDPYANNALAGISVSKPTIKGTAGDVLKAGAEIGGVALAPATIPGAIGAGIGIGAAEGAGGALQNDASLKETGKQALIGGAIGGATGGAVSGLGHLIGAIGDKITLSVIKPVKADIQDGFSIDTIKKYDLGGSLNTTLQKTQTYLSDLTTQLNEKLQGSTHTLNLDDVYKQTVAELTDASKLKGFGANTKIANTLNQLKEEVSLVNGTGGLSIPDAQVVKQAAGSFGAWQYGKVDPDSKAQEIVFNTFYSKLKTAIEQNSPAGVKEINQQLSQLIPVANAVIRRLPVAARANAIPLNEMIGLVGSSVNPIALGPTILSLISRSGAAGSLLGKLGPAASRTAVPAALIGSAGAQALSSPQSTQSELAPTSTQSNTGQKQSNAYPNPIAAALGSITGIHNTPEQMADAIRKGKETANRIDATGAAGVVGATEKVGAKALISVTENMRDTLINQLEKHVVPGVGKQLNLDIGAEKEQFLQFLKQVKNPTMEEMNKGLEILRLEGKDASTLANDIIAHAQEQLVQLQDKMGRFTNKFGKKK